MGHRRITGHVNVYTILAGIYGIPHRIANSTWAFTSTVMTQDVTTTHTVAYRALRLFAVGNMLPQHFHLSTVRRFFTLTGRSLTFGGMTEKEKALSLVFGLSIGFVRKIVISIHGSIHFGTATVVTTATSLVLGRRRSSHRHTITTREGIAWLHLHAVHILTTPHGSVIIHWLAHATHLRIHLHRRIHTGVVHGIGTSTVVHGWPLPTVTRLTPMPIARRVTVLLLSLSNRLSNGTAGRATRIFAFAIVTENGSTGKTVGDTALIVRTTSHVLP